MTDCCQAVAVTSQTQRRVLLIVLWINAAMFVVELGAALLAGSTALLADSVDMLGDAIVYGFSLYVLGRGPAWQARAARTKGLVMAAFGRLMHEHSDTDTPLVTRLRELVDKMSGTLQEQLSQPTS